MRKSYGRFAAFRLFLASCAVTGGASWAAAQSCGPGWLQNTSPPTVSANVFAVTTWDPDGAGPLGPQLIAGGDFSTALPGALGLFTGSSWISIGGGTNGTVCALATAANGDLLVGGSFTQAGGTSASNIARWTGSSWSGLGSGISGNSGSMVENSMPAGVRAIVVLGNGDIVAAGKFTFTAAGSVTARNIARFDGSAWNALGAGITDTFSSEAEVDAMVLMPNGDLIVGGHFDQAGSTTGLHNLAKWNGSSWSDVGGGITHSATPIVSQGGWVFGLAQDGAGNLYVGGYIDSANGSALASEGIARFDGSSWHALGSGATGNPGEREEVSALTLLANGDLIACGEFDTIAGFSANSIARWNGSNWSTLGSGLTPTTAEDVVFSVVQLPSGDIVPGGNFTAAGGSAADAIAAWNGSAWRPLTSIITGSFNSTVNCYVVLSDGTLVAGGAFTTVDGLTVNSVARWNGLTWTALGTGMNSTVLALERIPVANAPDLLVAGGDFTTADGNNVNRVAIWDGSSWQPMNSGSGGTLGMNSTVRALAWYPDMGQLIAGGDFTHAGTHSTANIAAWTGPGGSPNWVNPFGLTGLNSSVFALAYHPSTHCVIVGGSFSTADGNPVRNIAKLDMANMGQWLPIDDDATFTTLVGTDSTVNAIAVSGANIFVGGSFSNALDASGSNVPNTPFVARWTGSAWAAMGTGMDGPVNALAMRTSTKVAVGGSFSTAGGNAAANIAYWDGSSWSALGAGTNSTVNAIAIMPSKEVEVGGSFSMAGSNNVAFHARWSDDGKPWFAIQPPHGACPVGGDITVSGTVATGYDFNGPLTFQWSNANGNVSNGAQGAAALGGTVSGATADTLTISSFNFHDRGAYVLRATNSCGFKDSNPSILGMGCAADFNADCNLGVQDIFDFLNAWFAGDSAADFDHSAPLPQANGLSVQDIFDFLNAWFLGCT